MCYAVVSMYICCYYCCRLDYKNFLLSYFASLDAIAASQFTMSVSGKLYRSNNFLILFMYVVIRNVTDDVDIVSCNSNSIIRNVGLSVGVSVCLSTKSCIAMLCCQ